MLLKTNAYHIFVLAILIYFLFLGRLLQNVLLFSFTIFQICPFL